MFVATKISAKNGKTKKLGLKIIIINTIIVNMIIINTIINYVNFFWVRRIRQWVLCCWRNTHCAMCHYGGVWLEVALAVDDEAHLFEAVVVEGVVDGVAQGECSVGGNSLDGGIKAFAIGCSELVWLAIVAVEL